MDMFKMPDFGGLIDDLNPTTNAPPQIKRDRYGFVLHDEGPTPLTAAALQFGCVSGIDIGLSAFGDAFSAVGNMANESEKEQIASWVPPSPSPLVLSSLLCRSGLWLIRSSCQTSNRCVAPDAPA